ncbi:MAG TPA: cation:dicarboxylase symporter family transporter, partial [Gemmatimonadaceae bacterium]|nr:cation:dicarboxylase symporter family transporter [Gemmatimonadaceae bacterium]
MKDGTRVLIALGAALAAGIAVAASGNTTLLGAVNALVPIGTIWVNAIRMTVIPLVVALLITGVASAADVKSLGRIGGRTLLVFVSLLAGLALVVAAIVPFVFTLLPRNLSGPPPLPAGAAEAAGQLGAAGSAPTFAAWLVSLVPSNPIAAAANGQIVPLIIFTLLFGLAIAHSPTVARQRLVDFFEAVRDAMLVLVRWVIDLAPIGVFALVLPLAARSGAALAGAVGVYIVAYSAACLIATLLLYPVAAVWGRVSMSRFARAALPAQLIAFSSSSSIASLPALVESAERDLGLPTDVTSFVVPLAVSAFKIAAPVSWTVGALFIAWFYGVSLHGREFATIAFAAVFFA